MEAILTMIQNIDSLKSENKDRVLFYIVFVNNNANCDRKKIRWFFTIVRVQIPLPPL